MALKQIGVLWKKDKNGKKFLSGTINNGIHGDIAIMVFFNDSEQRTEKSPDYRIVMVTDDEKNPRSASQSTGDDFMDGGEPPQDEAVIDVEDIAF